MTSDAPDCNAESYNLSASWTADIVFYAALVKPETRVLEFGCGSGRVTAELLEITKPVVAVDLFEPMEVRPGAATP